MDVLNVFFYIINGQKWLHSICSDSGGLLRHTGKPVNVTLKGEVLVHTISPQTSLSNTVRQFRRSIYTFIDSYKNKFSEPKSIKQVKRKCIYYDVKYNLLLYISLWYKALTKKCPILHESGSKNHKLQTNQLHACVPSLNSYIPEAIYFVHLPVVS